MEELVLRLQVGKEALGALDRIASLRGVSRDEALRRAIGNYEFLCIKTAEGETVKIEKPRSINVLGLFRVKLRGRTLHRVIIP